MRLRIRHRTTYRYSSPVSENYNEVRLQPVSDAAQDCHRFELVTRPGSKLQRHQDFHLNLVDHFYIPGPHESLVVEAQSEVTTTGVAARLAGAGFPMSRIGECRRIEGCFDFLQATPYVGLDVGVLRLAQEAASGAEDAWEAVLAMSGFVHREFSYDSSATTSNTTLAEVLVHRRGVCQDFAHVLLGLCRSMGIPARYVSGYLHVGDEAGWRGNLATHAWIEVFLPGHKWLPLDPTNNRPADQHHIKVAVGRDYADAAPLRGNFKGRATQEMAVELEIVRVEASGGARPSVEGGSCFDVIGS